MIDRPKLALVVLLDVDNAWFVAVSSTFIDANSADETCAFGTKMSV